MMNKVSLNRVISTHASIFVFILLCYVFIGEAHAQAPVPDLAMQGKPFMAMGIKQRLTVESKRLNPYTIFQTLLCYINFSCLLLLKKPTTFRGLNTFEGRGLATFVLVVHSM